MSSATLSAPPPAHFVMPHVAMGDDVLFSNGTQGEWYPAKVIRVGTDSIEVVASVLDGRDVHDNSASGAHLAVFEPVHHGHDPHVKTEQFKNYTERLAIGGLWKHTESTIQRTADLESLRSDLEELQAQVRLLSVPSRSGK